MRHAAGQLRPASVTCGANTTFTQAGSSSFSCDADRRGERGHGGGGISLEQFDDPIDGFAGKFGLVALHVDDDIDVAQLMGNFGDAVGAAGAIRGWSGTLRRRSRAPRMAISS